MTTPQTPADTNSGLAPNVAGALCYLLGIITGVLFLLMEKENRFVRFHAAQSITVSIVLIAVSIVFSILSGILAFVPVLGWLIALVLSLVIGFGSLFLWLFLMYAAYQGREFETPIAGPLARKMM